MTDAQTPKGGDVVQAEAGQVDVVDYKTVDEIETCVGVDADGSQCGAPADYVLAVQANDTVGVEPFCEDCANIGDAHEPERDVIAPDDKSGFEPADVLEKAETDDEVYMEFEVEGREGTYGVRSKVANTSETEQDNGKKLIEYHLEARGTVVRTLTAKLLTDPESAYNCILDSVDIEWMDGETPTAEIYDVVHVEVELAVGPDGPELDGRRTIPSGPHENPYDEDYKWWASEGRVFFRGHEFSVTCENCGEAMAYDSLYGDGMEVNFVCESDKCATEQERIAGEGTFQSKRSVSVCPSTCAPGGWQAFVDGSEASIERAADGDGWRIDATDEDASYVARLEAETLAEVIDDE